MADVGKVYGVAIGDLAKVYGIAVADLAKIMGLDVVTGGVKGYIVGGSNPTPTYTADVDRTLFATDTTSTDGGNLPTATRSGASNGSGDLAVYTLGGQETGGANTDVMRKHTVATDAISTPVGVLSAGRRLAYSLSERITKGYVIGGYVAANVVTADILTFATEAVAATASADKTAADRNNGGVNATSAHGYLLGGETTQQRQEKVTFSTDSTSLVGAAAAPNDLDQAAGLSDGTTNSYIVGEAGAGRDVMKTVASTDAMSDSGANTATARWAGAAFASGAVSGYWVGGRTTPVAPLTQTLTSEKFTFSTETAALTASADRPSGYGIALAGASDVGL